MVVVVVVVGAVGYGDCGSETKGYMKLSIMSDEINTTDSKPVERKKNTNTLPTKKKNKNKEQFEKKP